MKIVLIEDEYFALLNILNEICNGFYINNFEKFIGTDKLTVVQLLNKVSLYENQEKTELKTNNKVEIILNNFDIHIINNIFREVFKEIEEWEFQTRIGISRNEAEIIRDKLNQLNDNPNSQSIPTKKI